MTRVVDLLHYLLEERGSDLLVKVGSPPCIRRNGRLERTTLDALDPSSIEELANELLPPDKAAEFKARGEVDLAHSVPGLGRFRVSAFYQRNLIGMVLRRIEVNIPKISPCPGGTPSPTGSSAISSVRPEEARARDG